MKQEFGPRGWTPDGLGSLAGKTYVITGANAGTGFEAARLLLSKGARVVMMNRSTEKSAAAIAALQKDYGSASAVQFVRMDLNSLASVRDAAAEVLAEVEQIDALVCNAAIAQVPRQRLSPDGVECQLAVNHLGHFLLCGLLFDRINRSAGRIVVVGSGAYRMGSKRIRFEDINFDKNYSAWNAYAQSKLAQMMFAYELQRRIGVVGKSVQVQVCHPGASRTSLIDKSGGTLTKLLWSILAPIIAQSAEKGAWPEVMCAAHEGLSERTLYGPTKRGETVGPVGVCKLDPCALEQAAAEKLWELSEHKTAFTWSLSSAL